MSNRASPKKHGVNPPLRPKKKERTRKNKAKNRVRQLAAQEAIRKVIAES